MAFRNWLATLAMLVLAAFALGQVRAADMPGASDHPAVERFAGSSIVGYEVHDFDALDFQTSTFKEFDLGKHARVYVKPPLHLEGKLTRFWYEAPGKTRSLEIYRNYANELTTHGFHALYDSTRDPAAGQWTNFLASMSSDGTDYIKNDRSQYVFYSASSRSLHTGTFQKGNVTVRLTAIDWPQEDKSFKAVQGAYIAVDVMETQAMAQKMVVVSASEISQSLTANGKVAIYGILFDTNKAIIKPASRPSIDQIATFLKANPRVKLHVVGHTDSVGSFESNLQLSRRRAEAVAKALTQEYGIAAGRLIANGVASLAPVASNATEDGRARNRRVELVLQ